LKRGHVSAVEVQCNDDILRLGSARGTAIFPD